MKFNTKTKQWEREDDDEPRAALIRSVLEEMGIEPRKEEKPWKAGDSERRKGDRRKPAQRKKEFSWL